MTIRSYEEKNEYVVEVEDDGAGFDVSGLDLGDDTDSAAPSSGNAPDGHIGLKNIRFRVQEITGGTLKIESHPGKGTKVTVSFVKTEVNTEKECLVYNKNTQNCRGDSVLPHLLVFGRF